jgi:hypothetical protein
MAHDTESFNNDLYDLLKVRGYKPVPLNSQNQRVTASQEADVIEFTFTKDGKDYGKAWTAVDDAKNVKVYYDNEQQDSPDTTTPGVEYDDTWSGFLRHLKKWAQRRQLSFELANGDRLGDDMRQRDYYKMKEKLGEGYYPMGKKASYNDAVPNVKIVLQHNRALEEGEQRYRNVDRIFLENADGERFLAPTTKPGIARVYARHIAEGGVPNDDRWNHIKSVCEDYNKMAGFVRATRNKEFNESAQELINEGANHYTNLRETLHKLTGHRGYHAYFESWTPSLMEDEGDDIAINELFVQETVDPRIESVMPILSKLRKNVAEMSEVDSLAEWADSIISEKLEMDSTTKSMAVPADKMLDEAPGAETLSHNQSTEKSNLKAFDLEEMDKSPEANPYSGQGHSKSDDHAGKPQHTAKMMAAKQAVKVARKALDKAFKGDVEENFISMAPQAVAEEEVEESGLQAYLGKKKYGEKGMKALQQAGRDGASKEKMATIRAKHDKLDEISSKTAQAVKDKTFKNITGLKGQQGRQEVYDKNVRRHTMASNKLSGKAKVPATNDEVDEGLDANQKRVGQLGPTEKVKNNNIGKLVGANESTEIAPELARIIEMARFKR